MKLEPTELFAGIASGTRFARYHSLVADANSLPKSLTVTATCETYNPKNGVSPCVEVMAVQHREHQTFGVQFHPESILTEHGHAMLANFLKGTP